MIDHIVKVAEILSQPDLEDETKKVINEYIRSQVKGLKKVEDDKPDPRSNPNVMKEWLEGPQGGDEQQ